MKKKEDMEATQQELARRHSEAEALRDYHSKENRRHLWRTLPRNIALILAAILIIWAAKSCESKERSHDPDRTGLRGMPI